ncbi:MAG: hypothetical protein O2955_12195 [Planctomycetota bacterium]|nr:hypothetical protein [Planctomycetota bacterium]MDA1213272.1 hypothetical protein [Planctomycetota bacterium]
MSVDFSQAMLPRYDRLQSYEWNYDHAPNPVDIDVPEITGDWSFLEIPVASPVGIAAGPLLNGRWVLYYASLGFDVLTYKTVRSIERACYPAPNLVPVRANQLAGAGLELKESAEMNGTWAVSFGMPSKTPDYWRHDIAATRKQLSDRKVLSVSVVGTIQPGWTIDDLADDYAQCAKWAVESGADVIEANFSCPNVSTCDGQLYQQPESAACVAERIRSAIGSTPFLLKVGYFAELDLAGDVLDAVAPYVSGWASTNSVIARVRNANGELEFDGQPRGICGDATRTASIAQTEFLARKVEERGYDVKLIGVGGVATAEHVQAFLDVGAEGVHLASSVMVDPAVGLRIKESWT